MERLKKRRDFLRVQKGRRVHTGLFSVQALVRGECDDEGQVLPSRIGFTVSKKVSLSAVKRNRIRRRLKAAAGLAQSQMSATGVDCVIVARIDALRAPFTRLCSELSQSLLIAASIRPVEKSARPSPSAP